MTCIVGVVDEDEHRVIFGSDSLVSGGDRFDLLVEPKIFCLADDVLIGMAGNYGAMQIVKYQMAWSVAPTADLLAWMVNVFSEALRVALEAGGFAVAGEDTFSMLVAVRDHLFEVGHDFTVTETTRGFAAIGVAGDVAFGCLAGHAATADRSHGAFEFWPEVAARHALEVAADCVMGVAAPFHFLAT